MLQHTPIFFNTKQTRFLRFKSSFLENTAYACIVHKNVL